MPHKNPEPDYLLRHQRNIFYAMYSDLENKIIEANKIKHEMHQENKKYREVFHG